MTGNGYGLTEYPTLPDLYNKDVIVDKLGYHQEVQSNVKAALQARIYSPDDRWKRGYAKYSEVCSD